MKKPSKNSSDRIGGVPRAGLPARGEGLLAARTAFARGRRLAVVGLCLVLLAPAACTTLRETASDIKKSVTGLFGGSDEPLSAEELALRGMEAYDAGNYRRAVEHFQKLKDIYPFSRYAILAELKLGDAHYRLEQYEDALFAYEDFEMAAAG